MSELWSGRAVLVTGGLGFIGRSLNVLVWSPLFAPRFREDPYESGRV